MPDTSGAQGTRARKFCRFQSSFDKGVDLEKHLFSARVTRELFPERSSGAFTAFQPEALVPDALNPCENRAAGKEGARVAGVGAPLGLAGEETSGGPRRERSLPQHQPAALAFPREGSRRRVARAFRGVATGGGGRSGFVQNFGDP